MILASEYEDGRETIYWILPFETQLC